MKIDAENMQLERLEAHLNANERRFEELRKMKASREGAKASQPAAE